MLRADLEISCKLTEYSDQLRQNVLVKQYYCDIDIAHLISYNEELAHKLTTEPADIIPLVSMPSDSKADSDHLARL
jgi:hypothetical protein